MQLPKFKNKLTYCRKAKHLKIMRYLKLIVVLIVLITVWSCASTVPLDRHFYSRKKVAVIIQVDSIKMSKAGGQGLLDMALTSGNRFTASLKEIEPKMHIKERLKDEMTKILNSKSKEFVYVDENFDYEKLAKFSSPKSPKDFSKKDFRVLKTTYNVDEIIYVRANYGLLVSYYGMIETGKEGYVSINSQIINLEDNSLMHAETVFESVDIKGNWKEGEEYSNLKTAINLALDKGIRDLKTKYYVK